MATMNAVTPFNFDGAEVRVVTVDGEPWFVAKDVAGVLGYSNPLDAIAKHCKAVVRDGFAERDSIGRMQKTPIIPERDVYRLVMKSHLPAAERFEEWVVGEVLPSIRKTGGYNVTSHAFYIPPTYQDALRLAADLAEQNVGLQQLVAEQAPKVAALDRLTDAAGAMCMTDAAKHLNVPRKDLLAWLQANRWIYRRAGAAHWLAYQPRMAAGYLLHKVTVIGEDEQGERRLASQVRVTPKGMAVLARQMLKEA